MSETPFELPPPTAKAMQAERAVLCAMMMPDGAEVCANCNAVLAGPQDFTDDRHAAIYESIMELWKTEKPTDPVSVKMALAGRNLWEQVNGGEHGDFLLEVVEAVPGTASAPHYVGIVRTEAARREEMLAGARRQAALHYGAAPACTLADQDPPIRPIGGEPLPELPLAVLPPWVADYVAAVCDSREVSRCFGATLILGVLAGSCQRQYRVKCDPGWFEPLPIMAAPAMESGERKSSIHGALLAPVYALQESLIAEAKDRKKEVGLDRRLLGKQIKTLESNWEKAEDHERHGLRAEIAKIEAKMPPEITDPQLVVQSFSEAALCDALADNKETLLLASDEGGLFDDLAGATSATGQPQLELMLKCKDGSPYAQNRRGLADKKKVLNRPLASAAITPQPAVLLKLSSVRGLIERGQLARFMFVFPTSKMGERDHAFRPVPEHLREEYTGHIARIMRASWEHVGDPLEIPLSPDAYALITDFKRELEPRFKKGSGDLVDAMKNWGSKLAGEIVRIAGVCHVGIYYHGNAHSVPMSEETMAAAIEFGRALIPHAKEAVRLFGGTSTTAAALVVARWNAVGWPKQDRLSLTDWWRHGDAREIVGEPPKDRMLPIMEQLAAHGYVVEVDSPNRNKQGVFYRTNRRLLAGQA